MASNRPPSIYNTIRTFDPTFVDPPPFHGRIRMNEPNRNKIVPPPAQELPPLAYTPHPPRYGGRHSKKSRRHSKKSRRHSKKSRRSRK